MKFYGDFIGQDDPDSTQLFYGGDEKINYEKNLIEMPEDWIYRDYPIKYKYNKHGHRCKNMTEIDMYNYVLFTGCSHTEGIGLKLEDSFPYLISKSLNCDYYNLSLAASGIDVLMHNLLIWFSKFKYKPRCVFIQWPDHSRFLTLKDGFTNLVPCGSWTQETSAKKFIVNAEQSGFFNFRKHIIHSLITNVIDVPIVSIHYSALQTYDSTGLYLKKIDYARDRIHTGIKSHIEFSQAVLAHCKSLNI